MLGKAWIQRAPACECQVQEASLLRHPRRAADADIAGRPGQL